VERNRPDPIVNIETRVFSIPVQYKHLKTHGGERLREHEEVRRLRIVPNTLYGPACPIETSAKKRV
jgi:hypothetical protein